MLVLGLVALIIAWVVIGPTLANLRDIVIAAIGIVLFLVLLSVIGLVLGLVALVGLVRDRIPRLLDTATNTADTVRSSTGFMTERVTSPFIKVSAAAAGARAAAQALVRRGNGR